MKYSPQKIMLHERIQAQMATYCMIQFMQNAQNRQIHRDVD